jgi:phosphoglucosamine mutase
MRTEGYVLGGEQSGHVVMTEYANTGDGLLTALHLLSRVVQTKRPLYDLASSVTKFPQVLVNVKGVDRSRVDSDPVVAAAFARATQELGDSGRVLLRPSGTEPVIRVMVEAASHGQAERISDELAAVVLAELAIER